MLPDTTPTDERAERLEALRAALTAKKKPTPAESAQRLDDALARDQKIDFRVSQGEREMWDRAAQTVGVSTSEFVRDVVNRAAEEALAAAYATTE